MNLSDFSKNKYSQFGEDGILTKIFSIIKINSTPWCVDVGAWDGRHFSNVYNLTTNHNWSGLMIEGEKKRFKELQKTYKNNSKVILSCLFVTEQGSNSLTSQLTQHKIPKDFDLLSIDVDGNDYHIWGSLADYQPKVVVIEHNPTIPPHMEYIGPVGNTFIGSSVLSLYNLGKRKGYELVCCTDTNSIFVLRKYFKLFNIKNNSPEKLMKKDHLSYLVATNNGEYVLSTEPAHIKLVEEFTIAQFFNACVSVVKNMLIGKYRRIKIFKKTLGWIK